MDFKTWMRQVNTVINRAVGCSVYDLGAGETPTTMATRRKRRPRKRWTRWGCTFLTFWTTRPTPRPSRDYSEASDMSYVYLLHFTDPIAPGRHTTQHYIGTAKDLARRIEAHARGRYNDGSGCARLCAVAKERGIGFKVARLWRGGYELEKRLKNAKAGGCVLSAASRCPSTMPRKCRPNRSPTCCCRSEKPAAQTKH